MKESNYSIIDDIFRILLDSSVLSIIILKNSTNFSAVIRKHYSNEEHGQSVRSNPYYFIKEMKTVRLFVYI